jgi:hypothetical protein
MKKVLIFISILLSLNLSAQQVGGAGHDNGFHTSKCSLHLVADSTTTMTNALQWYPMNARMTNGDCVDFSYTSVGMCFQRTATYRMIFFGDSNGHSNKTATITYGLFVNDSETPVDGGTSPVTFNHANSFSSFSINKEILVTSNDTLKVKVMSDVAATILTIQSLNLTIMQTK